MECSFNVSSNLFFFFRKYEKGSAGWLSLLFDAVLDEVNFFYFFLFFSFFYSFKILIFI